jgi:hypothetical protein
MLYRVVIVCIVANNEGEEVKFNDCSLKFLESYSERLNLSDARIDPVNDRDLKRVIELVKKTQEKGDIDFYTKLKNSLINLLKINSFWIETQDNGSHDDYSYNSQDQMDMNKETDQNGENQEKWSNFEINNEKNDPDANHADYTAQSDNLTKKLIHYEIAKRTINQGIKNFKKNKQEKIERERRLKEKQIREEKHQEQLRQKEQQQEQQRLAEMQKEFKKIEESEQKEKASKFKQEISRRLNYGQTEVKISEVDYDLFLLGAFETEASLPLKLPYGQLKHIRDVTTILYESFYKVNSKIDNF